MSTTDLRTGDVRAALRRLTVPMLFGLVSQSLIGVADAYFVAVLGTRDLAGLGFTIPVMTLVSLLQIGFGVGVTAVVAQAVGQGDAARHRRVALDAAILSSLFTLCVIALGLLALPRLFAAMGAAQAIVPLANQYMWIYLVWAALPQSIVATGSAVLRAAGETRSSALILIATSLINVALDPLLIFGVGPFPRMGLPGAAVAAALAYGTTSVPTLVLLIRRKLLHSPWPSSEQLRRSWHVLRKVSLPAAFVYSLMPIGALAVTWLVGAHGPAAVAAFGVVSRIERVLMIVPMAMGGGLSPFAAQNWGAGQKARAREAQQLAARYAVIWGLGALLVFAALSGPLGRSFGSDPHVAAITTLGLRLMPLGYAAMGYVTVTISYFNAVGQARLGAVLGFLRAFGFTVPLAAAGSMIAGLPGLFAGCVGGQLAALLLTSWASRRGAAVAAPAVAIESRSARV
jgi:putative MATE family efflux protein